MKEKRHKWRWERQRGQGPHVQRPVLLMPLDPALQAVGGGAGWRGGAVVVVPADPAG